VVKFLIVRFSSIGDIVLTTPVIRCLKNQVEDAEVHYLTKKTFSSILAYNPYIDKMHFLEDSLDKVVRDLKKENYDYIIDLHHNLRTSIIKARMKPLAFSFNKLNIEKWLMVNFKVNRLPGKHIVDRYLDTIRLQMRTMAKAFRGKDGALIRALLAAAQLDPELAAALRERWTMPRRRMAVAYFEEGIRKGYLRPDADPNAIIDLLYAPMYYRLQMGTGPLSNAYIDTIFDHAMKGLHNR